MTVAMKFNADSHTVFEDHESEARSYCRNFNRVFKQAKGSYLYDDDENAYLDFLSCAGSLNYGHNPAEIKKAVLTYIEQDGFQGALDMHSDAKKSFIQAFHDIILAPRQLHYKMQFTSPSGASVVESAVKLARKVTQRQRVVAFTNGFHGMTGTALGLTGNKFNRQLVQDHLVDRMPFDQYVNDFDSIAYMRQLWSDKSSGVDAPAALIVELVQGEGGINVASENWVKRLYKLAKDFGVIFIVDDIQAGCGRTGDFFSFETFGLVPDLVCLSKSLSGYGYPLSLLLIKPELDKWQPGEDNGTFRGNTLAMVAAHSALETFWKDTELQQNIQQRHNQLRAALNVIQADFPQDIANVRGRGLMMGIEFNDPEKAKLITQRCFEKQLIVERCGNEDQVIKFFPPLNVTMEELSKGLHLFNEVLMATLAHNQEHTAHLNLIEGVLHD